MPDGVVPETRDDMLSAAFTNHEAGFCPLEEGVEGASL
jgi:hypothetical protein